MRIASPLAPMSHTSCAVVISTHAQHRPLACKGIHVHAPLRMAAHGACCTCVVGTRTGSFVKRLEKEVQEEHSVVRKSQSRRLSSLAGLEGGALRLHGAVNRVVAMNQAARAGNRNVTSQDNSCRFGRRVQSSEESFVRRVGGRSASRVHDSSAGRLSGETCGRRARAVSQESVMSLSRDNVNSASNAPPVSSKPEQPEESLGGAVPLPHADGSPITGNSNTSPPAGRNGSGGIGDWLVDFFTPTARGSSGEATAGPHSRIRRCSENKGRGHSLTSTAPPRPSRGAGAGQASPRMSISAQLSREHSKGLHARSSHTMAPFQV